MKIFDLPSHAWRFYFCFNEMTNIGLQIINSDSDKDYVTWQTIIPSGSQSFQINSINNIPINLTYYMNSDYIEIQHNIVSTNDRKIYYQNQIGKNQFECVLQEQLPPIRISLNTAINNAYTSDQTLQGYKFQPVLLYQTLTTLYSFADSVEKYFRPQSTLNSGAICFNNVINKRVQKLQNNMFQLNQNYGQDLVNSAINYINLRIDAFLYHYWIFDTTVNCAYRMIGLIRLYCPTSNNYITIVEPKNFLGHGLSVRYLFGKQVDINRNGTFTTTYVQPFNVQQLTMQQIINNINTFPERLICSLPALCIKQWESIYTAVGRTNYYCLFVPEVVTDYCEQNNVYWFANHILLSPNLYVQLVGAQDLYDGQNENGANQLVNLSSAIKQIDLEVWFYQTKYNNQSLEVDLPIFCPYIGNFLEYPQMRIICVSNQLQGITLQSTGRNGFSNVCFKQNLIDAPILWGQNMMSQQCLVGQNKSLVFTLYDNFGRKISMQQMDIYNNLLLEIQFQ